MKKFLAAVTAILFVFSFTSCRSKGDLGKQTKTDPSGVVEYNTVGTFDYSDFRKENKDKAKTDGFKVTKESACKDKSAAKKIASEEFGNSFVYNTIKIAFDRTEGIWRVSFSSESKTQHICIDSSGKTVLTVTE